MTRVWKLKYPVNPNDVQPVGLHRVVETLISARGYTDRFSADSFLAPRLADLLDPFLMLGMKEAVQRLMIARGRGESVCVYGDYDCDGITGTAVLISFFRSLAINCTYFIPDRQRDGYGLNTASLKKIIAAGAGLVISVDCGISAFQEAALCREHGTDLIVLDHHLPSDSLPHACSIVNPLQPGCGYPFKSLSAVGIAFAFTIAARSAMRMAGAFDGCAEPDLRPYLEYVALGTIADVVPLVGQNRILVTHGLKRLSATCHPGIVALKKTSGVQGQVTCGQVGFHLAPRLNAAGRMDSASQGVELLLDSNPGTAALLADELELANRDRRETESRIAAEAEDMISLMDLEDKMTIVLSSPGWHQGVVGIVASRLAERYHRPTILIAVDGKGEGKGSGRGIAGFHLLDALSRCSQFLLRYGGHRHAAGISISAGTIAEFAGEFEIISRRQLADTDVRPVLDIDMEVEPEDITTELVTGLQRLEPYGPGNPEPLLLLRRMTVIGQTRVGEGHIRMRLSRNNLVFNSIFFRAGDRTASKEIDIVFYPELNSWGGNNILQLRIRDFRPSE